IRLKVTMRLQFWLKLSQKPTFNPDDAYLWRLYFRTTREGKLTQLQLIKCIPLEGQMSLSHSPPPETGVDQFHMRGRIAYADDQKVVLRLERNENPPPGREQSAQWRPFLITVCDSLPEAQRGQFWDLLCTRKDKCLTLKEAHQVEETPRIRDSVPSNASSAPSAPSAFSTQSPSDSLSHQVIMIAGKQPEITIKFTTRPELPEQGKAVTLEVTGEPGITVRASLNRKTLKKQVEKMDSFTDWVAALSGKVARVGSDGVIELEAAGVTVFEKKGRAVEEPVDA
ncbi:MAG: hypothetical protein ACRDEA_09985, partial [Microcystaceae cyanobacterium]